MIENIDTFVTNSIRNSLHIIYVIAKLKAMNCFAQKAVLTFVCGLNIFKLCRSSIIIPNYDMDRKVNSNWLFTKINITWSWTQEYQK